MKKILFALELLLIGLLPRAACAQVQTYSAVSSATWCNIAISSSAPVRVDNFNGARSGLMSGRTAIRIINGAGTLHGGYSTALSTTSTNAAYGRTIAANAVVDLPISSVLPYYLYAEAGASTVYAIIEQLRAGFSANP